MTKEQIERMKILLKAADEILDKMDKSAFVLNFKEQTAVWDGVECDGYCWHDEAKELLQSIKKSDNE